MTDVGLAIKILAGGAAAVGFISLFPPLTTFTPAQRSSRSEVPQHVVRDNGLAFCRESLPGTDCACFARKAGEILNEDTPRASGWTYADPWELARTQATESCS